MIILNSIIGLEFKGSFKGCLFHEIKNFNVYVYSQSYIKFQTDTTLITSRSLYSFGIGTFTSPGTVGLTARFYLGGNVN
jgi:hypothetical protein